VIAQTRGQLVLYHDGGQEYVQIHARRQTIGRKGYHADTFFILDAYRYGLKDRALVLFADGL